VTGATVEACLDAIATRLVRALEYRLIAADGRIVHVRDMIRVTLDEDQRPVRACGVIVDVTAERTAREALELSEERYRQLFEDAVDMIVFVDTDGRIASMNRAGAHLLGWEPEQVVGRDFKDFLSPETRVVAEEQQLGGDVDATTYEVELISESGRRIPVEVCSRVPHRGDRRIGTHGVGTSASAARPSSAFDTPSSSKRSAGSPAASATLQQPPDRDRGQLRARAATERRVARAARDPGRGHARGGAHAAAARGGTPPGAPAEHVLLDLSRTRRTRCRWAERRRSPPRRPSPRIRRGREARSS
jgi:PAS domain S-box-containing protein